MRDATELKRADESMAVAGGRHRAAGVDQLAVRARLHHAYEHACAGRDQGAGPAYVVWSTHARVRAHLAAAVNLP